MDLIEKLRLYLPTIYENNIIDSSLFKKADIIFLIDNLVEMVEVIEEKSNNVVNINDYRKPPSKI